jgi:Tol biopolymer transport system component
VIRFTVPLNRDQSLFAPNTLAIPSSVAISPDGRFIAYVTTRTGAQLETYLRPLDSSESRLVPGTENSYAPIFSPDGQWIAVGRAQGGGLFKVPVNGGAALNLGLSTPFNSAYWGADGKVTLGSASGLQQISDNGGAARPLTQVRAGEGAIGHRVLCLVAAECSSKLGQLRNNTRSWCMPRR